MVSSMLVARLRRRTNIEPTMCQLLAFLGNVASLFMLQFMVHGLIGPRGLPAQSRVIKEPEHVTGHVTTPRLRTEDQTVTVWKTNLMVASMLYVKVCGI